MELQLSMVHHTTSFIQAFRIFSTARESSFQPVSKLTKDLAIVNEDFQALDEIDKTEREEYAVEKWHISGTFLELTQVK